MPEVFEVKAIKPKKMKVQAIRDEIAKALRAEGQDVLKEYAKVVATWSRRPKFEVMIDVTGRDASVLVGTDDKIFGYVDLGTRPHIIRPRRARLLRFRTGYQRKTTPGQIGSRRGGAYGETVYARVVSHPGNRPGDFTVTIQKRRHKKFTRRMIKALQAGSRKLY